VTPAAETSLGAQTTREYPTITEVSLRTTAGDVICRLDIPRPGDRQPDSER
jgi:hypothetical protein